MAGIDLNPESRSPGKTYPADTYLATISTCTAYLNLHPPPAHVRSPRARNLPPPSAYARVNVFPVAEQWMETTS